MNLFSLEGKVALVTGGNGGLGEGMALALRAAGAKVAITGRDPAKNTAAAATLGGEEFVFPLDVRDETSVEATVKQVIDRFGRLDILVNNAGLVRGGPVTDLSREDWDAVIGTHLTGSFLCAKHASKAMIAAKNGGKIVNIGSIYSLFGPPEFVDYASAKAGLLGLTRALAVDMAAHGIQVNAILPGWFKTDMTREGYDTSWGDQIRQKTPARRWGEPQDLSGAIVFLSSRASDYVTGSAILVDGGYSIADRRWSE
jgi:2-deoxy-D-gluconate 3-dehydrogenase